MADVKLEQKHPLAIRWFHWINFPVLALMIWSGLLIYWAMSPEYVVFGKQLLPDWFYAPKLPAWTPAWIPHQMRGQARVFYDLNGRLAEGLAWHFLFMWIFTINGAMYGLYLLISGRWRDLAPKRGTLQEALRVFWFDITFRKSPHHEGRFNGAQRLAYSGVVVMAVIQVITGIAIQKPAQSWWLTSLLGGYNFARIIHFAITWALVAFFFVHVLQVVRAGWGCFRAMITGYDLVPQKERAE